MSEFNSGFTVQFFDTVRHYRTKACQCPEPFTRILLLSLLDVLAGCAFPKLKRKNQERFVCLIDEYSGWSYKDYVSSTRIERALNAANLDATIFVNRIESWQRPRILRPEEADMICVDALKDVTERVPPYDLEKYRKVVEQARYARLLWIERNFAVHEFRRFGQGMELSNDNSTPYYHGRTVPDSDVFQALTTDSRMPFAGATWELVFPSDMISQIVLDCAAKLQQHFVEAQTDPYASFDDDGI